MLLVLSQTIHICAFLIALVFPTSSLSSGLLCDVGATVETEIGPITGHPARNRSNVSEYLGIPYAQPPVGDLRFAAPQKLTCRTPINASAFVSSIGILP